MTRAFLISTIAFIVLGILFNFVWILWSTNQEMLIRYGLYFIFYLMVEILLFITIAVLVFKYYYFKKHTVVSVFSLLLSLISLAYIALVLGFYTAQWKLNINLFYKVILIQSIVFVLYGISLIMSKTRKERYLLYYGIAIIVCTIPLLYYRIQLIGTTAYVPQNRIELIMAYVICFAPVLLILNMLKDLKSSSKRDDLLDSYV